MRSRRSVECAMPQHEARSLNAQPAVNGWTQERLPEDQLQQLMDESFWSLRRPPPMAYPATIEAALYAFGEYLIYAGPDRVAIRRADYSLELFSLDPPTDKASWEAFRDTLAPYQDTGRDPADLRSWFDAFSGPTISMSKARMEAPRVLTTGFQFVLEVMPDTLVSGGLNLSGLRGLEAGRHLIRYNENSASWVIEPAITHPPSASLKATTIQALHPTQLTLNITNTGNTDWHGSLDLFIGGELVKQLPAVLIPGGDTLSEEIYWQSRPSGEYDVTLNLDGAEIPLDRLVITSVRRNSSVNLLSLSYRNPLAALSSLILLAVGSFGLIRAWRAA